jgi:hypothetical protein
MFETPSGFFLLSDLLTALTMRILQQQRRWLSPKIIIVMYFRVLLKGLRLCIYLAVISSQENHLHCVLRVC